MLLRRRRRAYRSMTTAMSGPITTGCCTTRRCSGSATSALKTNLRLFAAPSEGSVLDGLPLLVNCYYYLLKYLAYLARDLGRGRSGRSGPLLDQAASSPERAGGLAGCFLRERAGGPCAAAGGQLGLAASAPMSDGAPCPTIGQDPPSPSSRRHPLFELITTTTTKDDHDHERRPRPPLTPTSTTDDLLFSLDAASLPLLAPSRPREHLAPLAPTEPHIPHSSSPPQPPIMSQVHALSDDQVRTPATVLQAGPMRDTSS